MKILMVTMGLDIGGAETHVIELSKGLAEKGHDITVASNGGVYTCEIEKAGIRHVKLPLNNKRVTSVARSYFGLKKLIKHGNFDIVHAHARIPAFICSLIEKNVSFRFVTTAHLNFTLNPLWQKMSSWGEKTIAVSEDIKEYLIEGYGVCADNISLTVNGVNAETFSGKSDTSAIYKELSLSPDTVKIVYLSRMDSDRSLPALLLAKAASEIIKRSDQKLEFIIAGGGDDYDNLKKNVDEANAIIGYEAVKTTGTRTDIDAIISCADIFIGVSRSLLEAMCASKPVIISGAQGHIGIIESAEDENYKTAIATNFCCRGCPLPTEQMLIDDIESMLKKTPEQLTALGEFNKSVINQNYSVSRMVGDCERVYEELYPHTPYKHGDIIISGYYGFSNMGDDSLLKVIIDSLKETSPDLRVTALTKMPKKMRLMYGVRCINRTNIFKIYSEMKRAKLVISGGGSLLQDGTSTKSLYYYTAIMNLAHRLKVPLMVYANGIGPLYREKNRRISAEAIQKAALVTLRDPSSLTELSEIGVPVSGGNDKIKVTADPAFLLKPASDERISYLKEKEGFVGGRKYFAVSLREGHNFDGVSESASEITATLVNETARACKILRETCGLYPVFIPMQPQKDSEICKKVCESDGVDGGIILKNITAPELTGILGEMEFVLGMRLHILIYAAAAAVPVIGLSYDPKIDALMTYINQPYTIDLTKVTADEIVKYADEILANRTSIAATLSQSAQAMKEKAADDTASAVHLAKRKR